jgi:hypothetical protein
MTRGVVSGIRVERSNILLWAPAQAVGVRDLDPRAGVEAAGM